MTVMEDNPAAAQEQGTGRRGRGERGGASARRAARSGGGPGQSLTYIRRRIKVYEVLDEEGIALIEKNAPDAFAKVKVIWKSPLIPSDPLVWRKDLPEETKAKLKDFFLTYGTEASKGDVAHEKEVLAGLEWAPFRPSSNDQLLPIRVMELTKTIAKIEADDKLSAEEKKAQIEKLQAEKAGYEEKIKSNQS